MDFPAPPEEDSPDLTDDEVSRAVPTDGSADLAQKIAEVVRTNSGVTLEMHELRKRKPHLYWRVKVAGGPTLVFLADWLQKPC